MTAILFTTIIVVFVVVLINVRRNRAIIHKATPESIPVKVTAADIDKSIPDMPESFGYKCMWYAIKTENVQRIAEILQLKSLEPCNWSVGVRKAYQDSVFITPAIGDWTLVAGRGLLFADTPAEIMDVKNLLARLSNEFGEAQFFCTHRIVEYHLWMKAIKGKVTRAYGYLGESDENVIVEGEPTDIEKGYDLINTFSAEAKDKNYLTREDIFVPDEQTVMEIAGNWSVDPFRLELFPFQFSITNQSLKPKKLPCDRVAYILDSTQSSYSCTCVYTPRSAIMPNFLNMAGASKPSFL